MFGILTCVFLFIGKITYSNKLVNSNWETIFFQVTRYYEKDCYILYFSGKGHLRTVNVLAFYLHTHTCAHYFDKVGLAASKFVFPFLKLQLSFNLFLKTTTNIFLVLDNLKMSFRKSCSGLFWLITFVWWQTLLMCHWEMISGNTFAKLQMGKLSLICCTNFF